MAEVKNTDLFEQGLFKAEIENAKKLLVAIKELEAGLIDIAKFNQKVINTEDNKTYQSIQKTKVAVKELSEVDRVAIKIQQQKKSLTDQLALAQSKEGKTIAESRVQIQLLNKANKQQALENQKLVGSYSALSAKLNRLRKDYKDVATAEGVTSKNARRLSKDVIDLDNKLKKIDATVGQSQRNVGNYGSAWSKIGSSFRTGLNVIGITAGIAGLARVITNSVKIFTDFQQANSNLEAVLGASDEEMKLLAQSAKDLGSATAFTASEVVGLETSFAKLGFPTKDILLMTESTLNAAAAMGSGLDEQAALTGATLKAFGLNAASAGRVNDVLAKSTSASALDFSKLNTAMSTIAPVAKSFGFSIEATTALLGSLSNAGFDASTAATSTRNILLNLADSNGKLAKSLKKPVKDLPSLVEGLKQLKSEGVDLGAALELTDKRSVAAFETFLEGTDTLVELNEALEKAGGTAKIMADTQLRNLAGKTKILNSAWEGLVLSFEDGNGKITKSFESIVVFTTELLNDIKSLNTTYGELIAKVRSTQLSENAKEDVAEFEKFLVVTNQVNQSLDERKATIERFLKVDLEEFNRLKEKKKLLKETRGENARLSKQDQQQVFILGTRIRAIRALGEEEKLETEVTEENTKAKGKNANAVRSLIGLIEKQGEVVNKTSEAIQRATSEEQILKLSIQLDTETEELERLKRIVSSTIEEIDKIELDLIEDQTERRIAQEIAKSEKLIAQIESNSRIEEAKKKELIAAENSRLALFVNEEEIKAGKERIKIQSQLSKAEFEQRRTGFSSEEEFEKEKALQFQAIRRKAIEDEIKLIEQFGGEGANLRIQQLKAELEGLNDMGKGFEDLKQTISDVVTVIGEIIDEKFTKRIEELDKQLDKTGENVDFLRTKASQGQLSAEESLAFEKKKEAELERERERQRKRQERTKAFFSVLASFQANDGNLAKTITDISVLRSLAGTLTAFDGVDDTGGRGNIDSKGGKIWTLHPHEQVYSKEDRKALGFRSRDEVKNIVQMFDSGMLNDLMMHDASQDFLNPSAFNLNGLGTNEIVSRLDKLNESINGIDIPSGMVNIDEVRGLINLITRKGNNVKIEKSKLHK